MYRRQRIADATAAWFAGRNRLAAGLCALLVTALLWTVALPPAQASRHTVAGWGMEQGLPHNLVQSVAQGSDGFIWLGTWEGVVRFNGRSFTVFDRQNTPGVELSGVLSILPEADGAVLFGTISDGVYRYHRGRWEALGGADARHLSVTALLRDPSGDLWIAAKDKLLRLLPSGQLLDAGATLGLPEVPVTALRLMADGAVLVATEKGVYQLQHGRLVPWNDTAGWVVRDLVDDGNDGWVVAADDGVHWLHGDGQRQHLLPGERVDAVRRDAKGALWLSLSAGRLVRLEGGKTERIGVPGQVSPALLIDREGLVWAGSTDGLFRIDEGAARGLTTEDGLGSDYVRALFQSDNGDVWIGHSEGLNRMRGDAISAVRLLPGTGRDASVLALAGRGQGVWAGTYNQGVLGLDVAGRVVQRISLPGTVQPLIRSLLGESDGGLWIGSSEGLFHYQQGKLHHYGLEEGLPGLAVHALYRDAAGVLWIGTNGGMAGLDKDGKLQAWSPDVGFPGRYVFDFLGDDNGDLWIASDHGLLRKRGLDIVVFDHRNGLPRDKVFRVIDDGAGHLWLPSNQGVFRLDRTDLIAVAAGARTHLAVQVLDHTDGMPSSQGNGASSPAGWFTREGELLFPTASGLAVIDPQRVDGNTRFRKFPVAIENVVIDGDPQPLRSAYSLPAGVDRIAVAYAGLGFRAPDKMRYRYRLEGFDSDWVDAGSRIEAVYTNLPPGKYRLRVQAMSLPLDWENTSRGGEALLDLDIAAPLWQRPWVRWLSGIAVLGLILLLAGWRAASYRRGQQRLSSEIAARTQELSEKNRALEQADSERANLLHRLEHQAMHDALTGLPNRRAGDAYLQQALQRAKAEGTPLNVALVDVDHFKQINDRYGHDAGDQVLRDIASLLQLRLGKEQFVARHGGEEFLIVIRGISLQEAVAVLQELRIRLARLRFEDVDANVSVTVSIGVAALGPDQTDGRTLLAAADRQLYRAKREGRNRVLS